MEDIFNSSYVTSAANCASGADDGFLRPGHSRASIPMRLAPLHMRMHRRLSAEHRGSGAKYSAYMSLPGVYTLYEIHFFTGR